MGDVFQYGFCWGFGILGKLKNFFIRLNVIELVWRGDCI